jgi:hypothetical protein
MDSREIVRRAIEFDSPPRLPFWQHWNHKMPEFPDDVCNVWEMDRAQSGWFFDNPAPDDWGCQWETRDGSMGQVVASPLASWSDLARYRPPDPRNPFYYERLGPLMDAAGGRYVALTAHNLLFSRLHKLRGFAATMEDFYLEPERIRRVLDAIVEFKIAQCDELRRRFGGRIHGLVEFGQQFRGKVCFLATVDIQTTMPRGVEEEVREEARLLVRHWGTPDGGLIVFDYGAWEAIGVRPEMPRVMFDEFARHSGA